MSFSRGSDAQAAAERYDLALWSECKEARLASRTQRLTRLLEQKFCGDRFLMIRGEVGSRGSGRSE